MPDIIGQLPLRGCCKAFGFAANPWIYFAAPLFTQAELEFNRKTRDILVDNGWTVFLPQEDQDSDMTQPETTYAGVIRGLQSSSIVVAVIDGADADSGTAYEIGYAVALQKSVFCLRTDSRNGPRGNRVNLMLETETTACTSIEELLDQLRQLRNGYDAPERPSHLPRTST
ncbi:MAG: nucleoside 2-deoxyribosyltransferase [Methanocalculaceae archaeon]|jgi:nucleoside 2-deoxyribosyltransferase|nr:nucleoside 2-deoxyribosyltransferase [Methanocalculaceae archaeon]